MVAEAPLRERPTARVLLFDAQDRILLMKGRMPSDPTAPGVWFTVGGGVDPGETYAAAAAREIVEETGLTDCVLGDVVWRRDQIFLDRKQRPILFMEQYFVARCGGAEPTRAGWQALEHEFVDDIRWWTVAELTASPDPVVPADLAQRIPEALAKAPPKTA